MFSPSALDVNSDSNLAALDGSSSPKCKIMFQFFHINFAHSGSSSSVTPCTLRLGLEKDVSIMTLVEALSAPMLRNSLLQPIYRNSTSWFLCLLSKASDICHVFLKDGVLAIASSFDAAPWIFSGISRHALTHDQCVTGKTLKKQEQSERKRKKREAPRETTGSPTSTRNTTTMSSAPPAISLEALL